MTDCPDCNGAGFVTVGGFSVSPFSDVPGPDPQKAEDWPCSTCAGEGVTDDD